MKYAIFADVHSNIEAFNVVCDYYSRSGIDRYVFLGDIVGYGGNPGDCLDMLRGLKAVCVAGNHDWAVSGKFSPNNLNLHAREAIFWTKKKLSKDDLSYLKNFHLSLEEPEFVCVHGSLKSPKEFNYIFDLDDAVSNFQLFNKKLCFVGHTHRPGVYCLEKEVVSFLEQEKIKLTPDKRYIVNVGSIGQPRDGDPRASFCIYDDTKGEIEIIRLGYDIPKAAASIINQNLPATSATRLYDGR